VLGLPAGERHRQIPGVADIDEEKDQQAVASTFAPALACASSSHAAASAAA